MEKIDAHISKTYPHAYWHVCHYIEQDGWMVMVDWDDDKYRIGAYALRADREYQDETNPNVWVEIPDESGEELVISILDGIISGLPAPVTSHT